MDLSGNAMAYIPIAMTALVAGGFVTLTMVASHAVVPKRGGKAKHEVFECGIPSEGNARLPFSVKYFMSAILFVLFDVEVIFMYPWAVDFRNLGSTGFIEMISYLAVMLLGFVYVVKKGVLNWSKE